MSKRYLLNIEYNGKNYAGFQRQKNAHTIQCEIEEAIEKAIGEKAVIYGSGRTDAGVHAINQYCHVDLEVKMPVFQLQRAINYHLTENIFIKNIQVVKDDFDAQRNAKSKTYVYRIINQRRSPLLKDFAFETSNDIDVNKMKKACEFFVGEHDFCGFMSTGSSIKTTTREIYKCQVEKRDNEIKIEIKANGFLYNMVRIISGTLYEVGIGKIKVEDIPAIIDSKDRKKAGKTLPARGLYLLDVDY